MPKIGSFRKITRDEYLGEIVTLSVQAANVRIVPIADQTGRNAVTHRVIIGLAEVGTAVVGRDTNSAGLEITIDDPSFVEPITAQLIRDSDGTFSLNWERS